MLMERLHWVGWRGVPYSLLIPFLVKKDETAQVRLFQVPCGFGSAA